MKLVKVSIDIPDDYLDFFHGLLKSREILASNYGYLVGRCLENAQIRIITNEQAIQELNVNNGVLTSPCIVYERADSACIDPRVNHRKLLQNPDVRIWLKPNNFRNFELNNEKFLRGKHHVRILSEYFDAGEDEPVEQTVLMTEEMFSKVKLFSLANMKCFDVLRYGEAPDTWPRDIDVNYVGTVDYDNREFDLWDPASRLILKNSPLREDLYIGKARRAAAEELLRYRNLKVLIGTNRALRPEYYDPLLLRSSIVVSPWGHGEYAWRDYEAIFAGSILIKPDTDHIETFSPDIYQSNKYYFKCRPDFSDLREVITQILDDKNYAIDKAINARADLLSATSLRSEAINFSKIFDEALGVDATNTIFKLTANLKPAITLSKVEDVQCARSRLALVRRSSDESEDSFIFSEDDTLGNSHDFRLGSRGLLPSGVYRISLIVKKLHRSHFVVHLHDDWQEEIKVSVNLLADNLEVFFVKGEKFKYLLGSSGSIGDDDIEIKIYFRITSMIEGKNFMMLIYSSNGKSVYFDGSDKEALEFKKLVLEKI